MLTRRYFLTYSLVAVTMPSVALAKDFALHVVVGSSLIEDIVLDLTQGKAKTLAVIPGSACPGHTDVKASDMIFAAKADLILLHGFQRRLDSVQQLLHVAKQNKRDGQFLSVNGSWTIPSVNREASQLIANHLLGVAPKAWHAMIQSRLQARLNKITEFEIQVQSALTPLKGKTVVAAEMQKEFAAWAGLTVAATFGSAESMSPKTVADIIRKLKNQSVLGVVENMQSGAESGLPVATEMKVPRCVLSNFPGATPAMPDYYGLLNTNVQALLSLLR